MPIATITPQSQQQGTSNLANTLLQGSGLIQNYINQAIQRGRDSAQMQFNQEQQVLDERQRFIANDRAERFDMRNRVMDLLNFGRALNRDRVADDQFAQRFGLETQDQVLRGRQLDLQAERDLQSQQYQNRNLDLQSDRLDIERAQQERLAQTSDLNAELTRAQINRNEVIANLEATIANPNATEEQRQFASESLNNIQGRTATRTTSSRGLTPTKQADLQLELDEIQAELDTNIDADGNDLTPDGIKKRQSRVRSIKNILGVDDEEFVGPIPPGQQTQTGPQTFDELFR